MGPRTERTAYRFSGTPVAKKQKQKNKVVLGNLESVDRGVVKSDLNPI